MVLNNEIRILQTKRLLIGMEIERYCNSYSDRVSKFQSLPLEEGIPRLEGLAERSQALNSFVKDLEDALKVAFVEYRENGFFLQDAIKTHLTEEKTNHETL